MHALRRFWPVLAVVTGGALLFFEIRRSRGITGENAFWLLVGVGMVFVEPAYNLLIRANLSASPPLSVFDIILLTAILFQLLLMVQLYERLTNLSRKVSRMHEGIAIMEESKLKIGGSVANV